MGISSQFTLGLKESRSPIHALATTELQPKVQSARAWFYGYNVGALDLQGYPAFDESTGFLSKPAIHLAAFVLGISLLPPMLYRLWDLSRHSKGSPTKNGQGSVIFSILTPFLFLSQYFITQSQPSSQALLIASVGFLCGILQFVEDGKVIVGSPEVLLYWLGMCPLYLSFALDSYLRVGATKSLLLIAATASGTIAFALELWNPERPTDNSFDSLSIFSEISSAFVSPVLQKKGEDVSVADLTRPPVGLNAANCYNEFKQAWNRQSPGTRGRLIRSILDCMKLKVFFIFVSGIIAELSLLLEPQFLQWFLSSLSKYHQNECPIFVCYYYAALCALYPLVGSAFQNLRSLVSTECQTKARVSLFTAIYNKGFNINFAAQEKFTSAKIMTLVSNDSKNVFSLLFDIPYAINIPITASFALWQLWRFLGPSFFAGLAVYIVILPVSAKLSAMIDPMIEEIMEAKDKRAEKTSNVFRNIKTLKLHAWEIPYYQRVVAVRDNMELKLFRTISYFTLFIGLIWEMMGTLVAAAVFTAYLYLEQGPLTPDVIFPSLLLLNMATAPFFDLPFVIPELIRGFSSQKRISALFNEVDHDGANYTRTEEASYGYEDLSVQVKRAKFSWSGEDSDRKVPLHSINLKASRGDLICITGAVGSGKTAFLRALAGEMVILEGEILLKGTTSFCSQDVWLQNMTLKENILFGRAMDESWYKEVISACVLGPDFVQLSAGDETSIGVRGVSLSGGQKARVALARAIYSRADIYLLDDVLSAVDEHVGGMLIRNLFSTDGLLATRTVILTTHSMKILPFSSLIISLKDRTIAETATFKDILRAREGSKTYQLIQEFGNVSSLDESNLEVEDRKKVIMDKESKGCIKYPSDLDEEPLPLAPANFRSSDDDDEENDEIKQTFFWSFKRYFDFLSPIYLWVFVVFMIIDTVFTNVLTVYLGAFSDKGYENLKDAASGLTIYFGIIISIALIAAFKDYWSFIKTGLQVSKIIHDSMVWRVMRAPLGFFDKTPIGRIINRFSGDIEQLDDEVPFVVWVSSNAVGSTFFAFSAIVVGSPISSLVVAPILWVANNIRKMYNPTLRKVTRIASAANSPILSHIEDSITGRAIVRTFGRTNEFINLFEQRINYWIIAHLYENSLTRWLDFRIALMSMAISLTTTVSVTRLVGQASISIGLASVVLNFALRLGGLLGKLLKLTANAEAVAVSLERLYEFLDLEQEAADIIEASEQPSSWPDQGNVVFKNLKARYSENGPDVLKEVSLEIKAGEKIGIVGRTGSGKSSLSLAVFRILEASDGKIEIDGIDISTLGLHDLRSRLSIIPQDAEILDGTIRDNLDPLGTADDARIWEVLELCHLKAHFQDQDSGLDTELNSDGVSLSKGQAQLLCLGRALIHDSRVLILDEATASVDVETDSVVQETIRKQFSNRTVITIAHRLNTIMDSDRIVVLDNGVVKEFDSPKKLMENRGHFFKLLHSDDSEIQKESNNIA